MSKIKETLEVLLNYYETTRQVGHTTAMMEGAKNTECLVVVYNSQVEKGIKKMFPDSKNKYISIYGVDKLKDCKTPLLIDNSALFELLDEALKEISKLECQAATDDQD